MSEDWRKVTVTVWHTVEIDDTCPIHHVTKFPQLKTHHSDFPGANPIANSSPADLRNSAYLTHCVAVSKQTSFWLGTLGDPSGL